MIPFAWPTSEQKDVTVIGECFLSIDGLLFKGIFPPIIIFHFRSMRAGNRKFNRGMRIDYCLISSPGHIVDAFLLDEDTDLAPFSDHCPVGLSISSDFFDM